MPKLYWRRRQKSRCRKKAAIQKAWQEIVLEQNIGVNGICLVLLRFEGIAYHLFSFSTQATLHFLSFSTGTQDYCVGCVHKETAKNLKLASHIFCRFGVCVWECFVCAFTEDIRVIAYEIKRTKTRIICMFNIVLTEHNSLLTRSMRIICHEDLFTCECRTHTPLTLCERIYCLPPALLRFYLDHGNNCSLCCGSY